MAALHSAIEAFKEFQKQMRESTVAHLFDAFQQLFAENPAVQFVFWRQYEPSYNDGEPCRFGMHDCICRASLPPPHLWNADQYKVKIGTMLVPDPSAEVNDDYYESFYDPKIPVDQTRAVNQFLDSLPESLLQNILGDSVEVVIWRGGLLTAPYNDY